MLQEFPMVGSLAHFRGPRVGFLRRQQELGLVLGVDEPSDVVHVSLLGDPPQRDSKKQYWNSSHISRR